MLSSRNWKCVPICCYQLAGESWRESRQCPGCIRYKGTHTPRQADIHTLFCSVSAIVGAHTSKNSGNAMCEIKTETERNIERERKRRMLLKKKNASNQHMSSLSN